MGSIQAVRDFKINCIGDNDYKINANVIVLNRDEEDEDSYIYNIFVDVHVDLGPNYHRVHVMWEQKFGDNFKDVDSELYGTYSTSYNEMEYRYKELTIYSDERKIIIRA